MKLSGDMRLERLAALEPPGWASRPASHRTGLRGLDGQRDDESKADGLCQ